MDADQLTSRGGAKDLQKIQEQYGSYYNPEGQFFGGKIQETSEFRDALSQELDKSLSDEFRELRKLPSAEKPLLTKRDVLPLGSEEFRAMNDLSGKYLSQIAENVHPSKQKLMIKEIERANNIKLMTDSDIYKYSEDFIKNNPSKMTTGDFATWMKDLKATEGTASKYAKFQELQESLPNVKKYVMGVQEPASVEGAFKARTKMRKQGEGLAEGEAGVNKTLMQHAENVQKDVMDKYLNASPKGQAIQAKQKEIARLYGMKEKLPKITGDDIKDSQAMDGFFKKISRARMNLSEGAEVFGAYLKLQDQINKDLGTNYDFVSNAVLRRVKNKSFWNDYLADGKAGLADIVWEKVKALPKEAFTAGKIRGTIQQVIKDSERDSETRSRQEKQANTELISTEDLNKLLSGSR
jgi:hypothetical protein